MTPEKRLEETTNMAAMKLRENHLHIAINKFHSKKLAISFCGGGRLENPEKNLSEQRAQRTNKESNPGHIGAKRPYFFSQDLAEFGRA